jgi:hypothetical protein
MPIYKLEAPGHCESLARTADRDQAASRSPSNTTPPENRIARSLSPFAVCDDAPGGEGNRAMELSRLNPFRRSWSVRVGRVRIFSIPRYWDVYRERFARTSWPRSRRASGSSHLITTTIARNVTDDGLMRAIRVPFRGPRPLLGSHQEPGTVRQRLGRWLIVVRRDRAELYTSWVRVLRRMNKSPSSSTHVRQSGAADVRGRLR